ncbi:hypothetical protein EW146_g3982 [Bondarzewia mesenterica]|uniref:REJ domain-containing protein n=1 Tax=Bondarzewia mesenterica TaxID=1095465 RepID=A0A4S4M1T3_9AGAM|nr:hypothetical protein EW146_g3982 [Bondarzewia mesenterica]
MSASSSSIPASSTASSTSTPFTSPGASSSSASFTSSHLSSSRPPAVSSSVTNSQSSSSLSGSSSAPVDTSSSVGPSSSAPPTTTTPTSSPTPSPSSSPSPTSQSPSPSPSPSPTSSPAPSSSSFFPSASPSSALPPSASSASSIAASSSAVASSSAAFSSSQSSSLLAPVTSVVATTVIGTNADGQTFTTTIASTQVITASAGASHSSGSSNTGAIVGGVVGGVVGLALLILLAWCWRRRTRKDDFDGNFDPDRVVRHSGHGPVDLVDGAEVTPYSYNPAQPQSVSGGTANSNGGMREHQDGKSSVLTAGMAGTGAGAAAYGVMGPTSAPQTASQYAPTASDPSEYPRSDSSSHYPSTSPAGSTHPLGDFRHPSPGPSLPATHSSGGGSSGPPGAWQNPRSAKEREAMGNRRMPEGPGGFTLANETEESNAGSGVVQHQDGGRVQPEIEPLNEIPPAYESISPDER